MILRLKLCMACKSTGTGTQQPLSAQAADCAVEYLSKQEYILVCKKLTWRNTGLQFVH